MREYTDTTRMVGGCYDRTDRGASASSARLSAM